MTPEARLIKMSDNRDDTIILDHLATINEKVDRLIEQHKETRTILEDHMKGEEHLLKSFADAFPNADLAGHRNYHDAVIQKERARKEFFQKLTFELAKWGLIGFVGWVVANLWMDFLKGPK